MGDILIEVDNVDVRSSDLAAVQAILGRVKEKRATMGGDWPGLLMQVERDARLFDDGALDLHDLHDLDNLDGLFETRQEELEMRAESEVASPKFKRPIQIVFNESPEEHPRLGLTFHVHLSQRTGNVTIELNAPTPGMLAATKDIRANDTLKGVNDVKTDQSLKGITGEIRLLHNERKAKLAKGHLSPEEDAAYAVDLEEATNALRLQVMSIIKDAWPRKDGKPLVLQILRADHAAATALSMQTGSVEHVILQKRASALAEEKVNNEKHAAIRIQSVARGSMGRKATPHPTVRT